MSYQHERLPKAHYTGNDYIPVSCEKELLSIRKEIENGVSHKGRSFEICYQAIKDIYKALGQNQPKGDCQNCVQQWNKLLNNWFKKYDNKPMPRHAAIKTEPKPLVPLKEKEVVLGESVEETVDLNKSVGIENNPELSDKDKLAHLKQECKDKGIKFHHAAGIKKLTELLGR